MKVGLQNDCIENNLDCTKRKAPKITSVIYMNKQELVIYHQNWTQRKHERNDNIDYWGIKSHTPTNVLF